MTKYDILCHITEGPYSTQSCATAALSEGLITAVTIAHIDVCGNVDDDTA